MSIKALSSFSDNPKTLNPPTLGEMLKATRPQQFQVNLCTCTCLDVNAPAATMKSCWLSVKLWQRLPPSHLLSLSCQCLRPLDPSRVERPLGAALTHSSLPVNVSDQMLCSTSSALGKSMDIREMIYDRVITQRQAHSKNDGKRWDVVAQRYCTKLSSAFIPLFYPYGSFTCNAHIARKWFYHYILNFHHTLRKFSPRRGIKSNIQEIHSYISGNIRTHTTADCQLSLCLHLICFTLFCFISISHSIETSRSLLLQAACLRLWRWLTALFLAL